MNERIIELANKANETVGHTFRLEDAKQLHELMEKFAELIIDECIQVAMNAKSKEAAAMIVMHFGDSIE